MLHVNTTSRREATIMTQHLELVQDKTTWHMDAVHHRETTVIFILGACPSEGVLFINLICPFCFQVYIPLAAVVPV
ncbi:hypothetical protein XELAEV_18015631mg [Xenopus laevis]|uniref:Uncharacterized protein n=1 Tax=Xenopus laevis TaxID=8355 RepID=A0A974DJJ8_XENLA|nr:hypothetical protein XELAEV_18015631mg [Xenopus laevis]